MPRPKVKPEDRQRCVFACIPCKRLKIRCDARTPCSTCIKRGRQEGCVYQDPSERKTNHGPRRRSTLNSTAQAAEKPPYVSDHYEALTHDLEDDPIESSEDSGPQSRTLLSSKFQKLYIGASSSLSYLQFMRETVKHCIGANSFSEGQFSSFMLESDVRARTAASAPFESTSKVEPIFVQSYLDATSGVLDLFTEDEIFESVDDPDSNMDVACRHLILAIGAQCRGLPPSDLSYAAESFETGQKLAFAEFLCDPSQDMVRRFLLLSFYMTAACHRNAAFMYLGVAWKAACALGLHRVDQYHRLSSEECVLRLKAWRSLRILDTIVNSILGRSGGTSGMQFDARLDNLWSTYADPDTNFIRERAVQAAFDLTPFLDELERRGPALDPAFTENFLMRLQLWSKALPSELRSSTDALATSTGTCRESFIGAAHVASMYYFAVILSTRRFFTLYVMPSVRDTVAENLIPTSHKHIERSSDLARVCLDAASNLASVGYNATKSDRSVNNMCLMKAWIFAAGLLLGFWLFAHCDNPENEVSDAFEQCRHALQKMAAFSPQAGHYYEILASLGAAIDVHRVKRIEERKRLTSRYVDQVLTFDGNNDTAQDGQNTGAGSLDKDNFCNTYPEDEDVDLLGTNVQSTGGGPYTPSGMTISEGFPWPADDLDIDWQPFAPFLDEMG